MRPVLALALALAGCASAPAPGWASRVAQADEAGLWIASESALLVVPGNVDPGASPEWTAVTASESATDPFDPNECVVATRDHATVTYQLDDCSGSFGLVHASGQLVVTFVEDPDGRTAFHASATDLVLNGGAVSFEADARVLHDVAAGERTIDLTIDTQGVGPAGTHFTRHGTQTARWSDTWGCLFVDASHDTLGVGDASWDATTAHLSMCVGECPELGGTITWVGAPGQLDLRYDGTRVVQWSVPSPAETGSMPIPCGI